MVAPLVSKFVKVLNGIDQSKRRTEVFSDFCEMAYCSLAKVASPYADQKDALEKQYMEVVGRYRNKDDVWKIPELLGISLEAIHLGGIDFLGAVAGELGALDARLGQFFTPYEISRLMAEINLQGVEKTIEENGFVTVSEPAVGAGGMVIAVADVIEGLGFDPARHLWVEAVELSRTTYYMAYVQINTRGVAGKIICGNSLSLETNVSAYTAAAPVFISKNGHPFAKQRAAQKLEAEATAAFEQKQTDERAERLSGLAASKPTIGAEQLGLFD
ncbi:MAG: N-6 DNA methylase [Pseudoruegeria sp.]